MRLRSRDSKDPERSVESRTTGKEIKVAGDLWSRGRVVDHDLGLRRTLLLSSSRPATRATYACKLPQGQARREKHGSRHLLRLVNANASILLSAHGHSLRILAADGNPVRPMTGTAFYSQKIEEEPKLQEEYIVSDIDPESITFMDCNEETNGSGTGSFNASLSEDAEESSSSSLKAMELYNGSLPSQDSSPVDLDGQTKLESCAPDEKERKKTKEEFAKFGESIAVQLAEIPDSYSRSVAKLRINQILFEAEIGIYAQTHR